MNETTASTPSTSTAAASGDPVADLTRAPLPTSDTLRKRQSLPLQAIRFAVFNTRIIRMVIKGHH